MKRPHRTALPSVYILLPICLLTTAGCSSRRDAAPPVPATESAPDLQAPREPAGPRADVGLETSHADHGANSTPSTEQKVRPASTKPTLVDSLLFFPSDGAAGDWAPAFAFEDVSLEAADGVKLHAWYLPQPEATTHVLYAHGNAGNVALWAPAADEIRHKLNASVLIVDYRGYGRSQGQPTVDGALLDIRAAAAELARRTRVRPADLVLWGRSLGGALAVDLAAEQGARLLVVESSFSSLRDVAQAHYPPRLVNWVVPDKLNSAASITNYAGPLLQVHGTHDSVIPYQSGQMLFQHAQRPKQFVSVPRGDHNDPTPANVFEAAELMLQPAL